MVVFQTGIKRLEDMSIVSGSGRVLGVVYGNDFEEAEARAYQAGIHWKEIADWRKDISWRAIRSK